MQWERISKERIANFEFIVTVGISFLQVGVVQSVRRCAATRAFFLVLRSTFPRLSFFFCLFGCGSVEEGLDSRDIIRSSSEWIVATSEDVSHASTVLTALDGVEFSDMSNVHRVVFNCESMCLYRCCGWWKYWCHNNEGVYCEI